MRGLDDWLSRGLEDPWPDVDDAPDDDGRREEDEMKRGDVFASNFLKAEDILGKQVRVTIENVVMEDIKNDDGGKDRKAIVSFVGKDKRFILNQTNWGALETVCRSDDSDHWKGWTIVLYTTKVSFGGRMVDAIRIDDRPGAAMPPATRASVQTAYAPPPPQNTGQWGPPNAQHTDAFERLREIAARQTMPAPTPPGDEWARAEESARRALAESAAEPVAAPITDDDIPF